MPYHLSRKSRSAIVALLLGSFLLPAVVAQQAPRQVGLNTPATAPQRRVALVIGNGAYRNIGKLKNPTNDARAMAAALGELGFEVASAVDADQKTMKRLIREFGEKLRATGGQGLFYYAGHGVQLNSKNYLIPVEVDVASEADLEDQAVDVQFVLSWMNAAQNGLNIVILDACRNNPFTRSMRAANDGLAQVDAPTGTLIAYATAPGRVASDGSGENGLYTQELLKQMKVAGLSESELFKQVRAGVLKATKGTKNEQVPWEASSLIGTFYFRAAPVAVIKPTPISVMPRDEGPEPTIARREAKEIEREAWVLIRNSNDAQDFRDFLEAYPSGANAGSAKIRLEQLAWEAARANGGKAALEGYLKEFPVGDNAPNAKLMLSRLARASQPVPVAPPSNPGAPARQQSNQYGIEFVAISAGTFTMGSPAGETRRSADEAQHQVTISRPFGLGKYEVTREQWQAVMGNNPSKFNDCGKCPVEQVSWEDVQQFIAKLNGLNDGYKYRLPTEAEWEYAARAGSTGEYAGVLDDMAWYSANSGNKTHPVGTKSANAWGLYDMHGNVWEWCSDWYGDYAKNAVSDPRGASTGSNRVNRGGSWNYPAQYARSAFRDEFTPGFRFNSLGFRLVRE